MYKMLKFKKECGKCFKCDKFVAFTFKLKLQKKNWDVRLT